MNSHKILVEDLNLKIEKLEKELASRENHSKLVSLIDEDTLRQMNDFNNIADDNMMTCIVDKSLSVKSVSKAFSDLFGYNNATFASKSFTFIVSPESAEKFYNGCEYVKNHDRESWGTELILTTVDNKEIYTKTIINPLFIDNELSGFIFVIQDISCQRLLHKLQVKMMCELISNFQ